MDPTDYYYKTYKNGKKYYKKNVKHIDGTYKDVVTSKKTIEKILDQICEYDLARDVIKLTDEKKALEEKKKKLFEEIGKLNIKIDALDISIKNTGGNYEEEIKKRNEEINRKNSQYKNTRETFRKKEMENAKKAFNEYKEKNTKNHSSTNNSDEAKEPRISMTEVDNARKVLIENGIIIMSEKISIGNGITQQKSGTFEQAKKQYKNWLIKNHSDKGGDTEKCKEVIAAFTVYENFIANIPDIVSGMKNCNI